MGACSSNNQIVSETSIKDKNKNNLKIQTDFTRRKDDVIKDKDAARFAGGDRMHEKLWKAVEANDLKAADKFLDLNDVEAHNMYDPLGQTMLHLAALLGHHEMLMILIDRTGAKPDCVNAQLATPLHLACKNNKESVVKFLIGCGVDVNIQDEHGQTPLLICCIHGHRDVLGLLVEASISGQLPDPIETNLSNHQGLTPLNCAAIKGDFEMVKILVSRGQAKVDQSSPKGCTPLIYSGRGGYSKCVEFLIDKKASALKQDNAGGTVLHHAIEKGHSQVLETMLGLGVDVYSAIEIADNAGRTPLFEAVENMDDEAPSMEIIKILTNKKSENGFGANPNVINYSGQTPLFSAARSGSLEAVKALIAAGAELDLNDGELVKPEDDQDEEFDSIEEQYFFEAFKNCMTPLHVASVLGYDEIALYLAKECGSDVNIQSRAKGYTALHLSVLSNKPEIIIELLTQTLADPMLEDKQGRALLDMVYQFIPSYVETFQQILETLSLHRLNNHTVQKATVARHYVNAEDERQIAVPKTEEEIALMYAKEMEMKEENEGPAINLNNIEESDLALQEDAQMDSRIENVFGRKVALCLLSTNWQYKELAMKFVTRTTEKFLTRSEVGQQTFTLQEMVDGSLAAVSCTCRDKVIKVFNTSLQLFNMVVQSSKIERDLVAVKHVIKMLKKEQLIQKFLLHSETSNTRVTNKIHEALLDLSYQAQLGENFVTVAVFDQIRQHYETNQNQKGLMAQLALLYKLINSFKVHSEQGDGDDSDDLKALTKEQILDVVLPSVSHTKDDIRGAATKILIDVQKQTKMITLVDLESLPEKVREVVWEKLSETLMLVTEQKPSTDQDGQPNIKTQQIGETVKEQILTAKLSALALENFKKTISDKGAHKDWTQREIALNAIQECFNLNLNNILDDEEEFLAQCSIILQTSLDENNIQIYLIAVEVVLSFILKVPQSEAVLDSFTSLMQSVVLRTTDTNTRVRKRSVEVLVQVWDLPLNKKASLSASQMIANVLCDQSLSEKAIIGRLGMFIKKALLIETKEDINKKPLQLMLGKDYEQLAQFACQWCLHKNTKVRQCALKLAVEICRLNSIDPRGAPFKKRIINFILGLRPSIRDPLVKKINQVCTEASEKVFIDESELELTVATKARAASYDVRRVTKSSGNSRAQAGALPQIGQVSILPQSDQRSMPTIVLPHSEPLSVTQLEQATALIELFGKELITCFYSQTWSSRFAAIQKVEEQLHNLDPNRRDAMSAEINRNNFPPEISFKTLLLFFAEGLKDPVLKNYVSVLELIQTVLPFYFRYLRGEQLKKELSPLVQIILQKTSDLKQKIREASVNICLYLSHQSPIGPEHMISMVLSELDTLSWEKQEVKKDQTSQSFGNSNKIVSCLNLLSQFQLQTSLVTKDSKFYPLYSLNINKALKHSNPQVRKEGESLFRTMFQTFQDAYIKELKDQKSQVVTKLIQDAKAEFTEKNAQKQSAGQSTVTKETPEILIKEQIRDDYLSQPSIQALLKGNEDKLHQLKLPNPKKRLIAIVEIKKAIQQKLTQINKQSARDLVEPLSLLLRHLLRDENVEVYMESLNLLKFIVGNLAPHLSALDLHLMIGQFLTVIVCGQNANMRARVASDKVIVYFAKHTNIGSLVVAKEILKNIERLNRSALIQSRGALPDEATEEKKQTLSRFYGILQMLLQQFSIVLCYQPDFYSKCLDLLSETMAKSVDEPTLKSTCNQMVLSLHQIDSKLLDQGVNKLDFSKKTHLKKMLIELENSNQKGLITQNQNLISGINGSRSGSPDASFRDTQQSFTSLQSRTSIMSPTGSMNRRTSRDRNSEVRSSRGDNLETPDQWRRMKMDQNQTEMNWLERKNTIQPDSGFNLPSITMQSGNDVTSKRRQVGQGYAGNSGKAAGFNRSEFNMTGEIINNSRPSGLNDLTVGGGIGSSLLTAGKKPEGLETITPKTFPSMTTINKGLEKADTNRPPLYVPSQRTQPQVKRQDSNGYQPTILQRMSTQNNTATSFGTAANPMGSTTSTVGLQPVLAKQSMLPPPAATSEVKWALFDKPTERKSSYN